MIDSISLYQFKNFADDKSLAFSNFNIIYGCNGRGKSSILQALLVLSQTMRVEGNLQLLRLNGEFVNLDRFEDVLCTYAEEDERFFRITLKSGCDTIEASFESAYEKPQLAMLSTLIVNGRDYAANNVGENDQQNDERQRDTHKKAFLPTSDVSGLDMLKNLFYISADRKGPTNTTRRNDNHEEFGPGIHGENLIQVLYQHSGIIQDLQKAMSEIFNGATIKLPTDAMADELKLLLDSVDGTNGYKPTNVGFGYSHAMPIIIQTLLAPKGSVLVIENPEAHLHPGAQTRIVEFLLAQMKKKDLQIFIESHSDHIINGVRLAVKQERIKSNDVNILFIGRDDNDDRHIPMLTNIQVLSNGALSEYPDDFMDEWTKQSGQLL